MISNFVHGATWRIKYGLSKYTPSFSEFEELSFFSFLVLLNELDSFPFLSSYFDDDIIKNNVIVIVINIIIYCAMIKKLFFLFFI